MNVWGGHSCPPPLTLVLILILILIFRSKSKAADRSVRSTHKAKPVSLVLRHEEKSLAIGDRSRFHRLPVLFQSLDGRIRALRPGTKARPGLGPRRRLHHRQFRNSPDRRPHRIRLRGISAEEVLSDLTKGFRKGFVEGHGFSRAIQSQQRRGL